MARELSFHHLVVGLLLVIATGTVTSAAENPENVKPAIRFAVIGDRTGDAQAGVYEGIVAEVARLRPDFVLTPGDLIEGYTNDTASLKAEWEEYLSLIKELKMPIYIAPGNHDITMDGMVSSYENHVGQPYYSANFADIHLIMLDVSRWGDASQLAPEQLEWLADDLEKSAGARYTIVSYHKPFWYNSVAVGKPDTLHSLFVKYGVDAVFTGHYHDYFAGEYDGIIYTNIGSSGGGMTPGPTGLGYQFLWVTIDTEGIHIASIDGGSVRPWDEIPASDHLVFAPIRHRGIAFTEPLTVDPTLASERGEISVVLKNSMTEYPLSDTLRWETPDGWTIEPPVLPVEVLAGEDGVFKFTAHREGSVYPLPTATVKFNYAEDRSVSADGYLRVNREVICTPVTPEVVIDGVLSETCWQNPVTTWFDPGGGEMMIDSFRFYFAYDKDNLYLAAYCDDAMVDSIKATVTEHDGSIYAEDCVGYFIEPVHGSDTVYQIYFNPLGTAFDQLCYRGDDGWMKYNRDWNGEYEVKTVSGDDHWSIEARIPLAQFGAIAEPGQKWRLNFRRKQKRFNGAADWQVPIGADPTTMGTIILR